MSDLISRKVLLAKVVEANPMGGMIGGKFIEDLIKTEPTAYDVDKVWNDITDRAGKATTKGAYRTYWECAKIVKGGGKDE